MIRIGILGLSGKMGQELKAAAELPTYSTRLKLSAAEDADLWIEFSSPAGALELCKKISISSKKAPLLVGSTGWTAAQTKELETFALQFPILKASNFAFGIQLCRITLMLWATFPEIKSWTAKIREVHHTEKKDSPSGTALALQEALGGDIPITSVRSGGVVGIHEVTLTSETETLTLIHEAKRRSVFAEGALDAAIRLAAEKNPPKRLLKLDDLYLRREA